MLQGLDFDSLQMLLELANKQLSILDFQPQFALVLADLREAMLGTDNIFEEWENDI